VGPDLELAVASTAWCGKLPQPNLIAILRGVNGLVCESSWCGVDAATSAQTINATDIYLDARTLFQYPW
jgi:hypothetical protein